MAHTTETLFPLPDFKDVLEGTVLETNDLNKSIVEQNHKENLVVLETYQEVQTAYLELWKLTADGFLNLKNLLNFFL